MWLQSTAGPGVQQIWGPLGVHCFASPPWFYTMDVWDLAAAGQRQHWDVW